MSLAPTLVASLLLLLVEVSEWLGVLLPVLVKAEGTLGYWLPEPDHWVVHIVGLLALLAEVVVGVDEGLEPCTLDGANLADITDDAVVDSLVLRLGLFLHGAEVEVAEGLVELFSDSFVNHALDLITHVGGDVGPLGVELRLFVHIIGQDLCPLDFEAHHRGHILNHAPSSL